MKPLKLTPAYKDYIWGGTKLKTEYVKKTDISPVAESWELSCHKDGLSMICGGEFDGQTAFKTKDKVAKSVVKTYLGYLAEGIVNIVNIFQPEIVCIGGGISHEGEKILTPVKKMIKNKSFARFGKEQSKVCLATLGNDAGLIGAALLWKNDL